MQIKFNSILISKKFLNGLLFCSSVFIFSCDEASYDLNNPFDPENMDLDPPALFFHPSEIDTKKDSSFSVQLYGLKLNPAAAAQLDVRYDWGSVKIDSVKADTFFQSQNDPIQIVMDEDGTLDIFIYLLPDSDVNQNEGGTWPLATVYFTAISTGDSELLFGNNTRLRDANNDSVRVKSFGSGFIYVE
ncbi:MAG: hypothetical protein HOB40_08450 [Candidatus Marinimicrobia bacterium]|jgi:hypothetical protein|nr:hypothetical protein [Candidatus Neomarinimicrobiota bacterium]MBT3502056.1 hypothetical protein [Candidatus Neomarinimicrobiota bacterium]MBT3839108.1 hypothetical protein [Candidatus Neomarinimicrobiota bacterium]MBT3998948.1 hypothetical protein [Candidatus Neomarinimicrobiota bacterium]MBT4283480.1 hypothetical protein [Candidatus Neomarinimicrobiota bacterium]